MTYNRLERGSRRSEWQHRTRSTERRKDPEAYEESATHTTRDSSMILTDLRTTEGRS